MADPRTDLELAHSEVEIGDEEHEEVFNEHSVGFELYLGSFVHLIHHLAFDVAEGAFCGLMCLSIVFLAKFDHT